MNDSPETMSPPPRPMPTLRASLLVLRPFRADDAPAVQRLAGAREIADTTANLPHPYPDGVAGKWIAGHAGLYAAGQGLTLAVTLAETGELVGAISLMSISAAHQHAELGYWIGHHFWGRGYCTEAAREIVRFAFDDMGLNRVHAYHFSRNPASGRVMRKIGMRHEGTHRQHVRKWDRFEDTESYGMLKSDPRTSEGR